jgi:hypothetical protein
MWLKNLEKIIIKCWVFHYKDGNLVENAAIKTFIRELIASDSMVNPANGVLLTDQQLNDYAEAYATEQAISRFVDKLSEFKSKL